MIKLKHIQPCIINPYIGLEVRIKPDLIIHNKYNNTFFVESMNIYSGNIAIITNINEHGRFNLDIDNGEWFWTKDMVSLIKNDNI